MKKILVPIDLSPSSYNVCDYAALLAKTLGATIHLMHAYVEEVPVAEGPVTWAAPLQELRKQAEKSINKEIKSLEKKYAIEVEGEIRQGFKSDSISEVAKEIGADLIVMGVAHEKHNKLLGGTFLKVIRKSETPVLIVPEHISFKPIKNIVLTVDFTEMISSKSFDPLFAIVKKLGASLRVIHVEKKGADLNASEVPEKIQLEQTLSRISFVYHKIDNNDVEQGIMNFIEKYPTDWLVMVAHHHNFFERIFGDIHTRSVGFAIQLPLLVLHTK
jgi:nucleotide-binding universal stress UspA family protein